VAAVPGPGSKSSSCRIVPWASITKTMSGWPSIAPAGSVCAGMPYARYTWRSRAGLPVRYRQLATPARFSWRSNAWV